MFENYDLTTPQNNIWNLHKYYEGTAIANQCGAVIYDRLLDSDILKRALQKVVMQHNSLRIRLKRENPVKQYFSYEDKLNILYKKIADEDEFDDLGKELASTPITDYENPLYKFVICDIGKEKTGILAVLSHVIADAWAFSILVKEVDEIYNNILAGDSDLIMEKYDYLTFVSRESDYLKSSRFEQDKVFWKKKYSDEITASPIRLTDSNNSDITAKRISAQLSTDLDDGIDEFCNEYGYEPAVLFETAIIAYLAKINPESRNISTGMLVLNRNSLNDKKMIGMFVSTMPFTITVDRDMSLSGLLSNITIEHKKDFRHQRYPYSEIIKDLRKEKKVDKRLYDVMISYQNAVTNTSVRTKWFFSGYSEVPLAIHIDNRDQMESRTITIDYQVNIFDDEQEVFFLLNRIMFILQQIISSKNMKISDLSIVPDDEKKLVLHSFNDTYVDYDKSNCIVDLFEEQVLRNPDKEAIVFEKEHFSYSKLDQISNSVAYYVKQAGIKANNCVAIISNRNWRILAAMLGIIKAGGAFINIDPHYPQERIEDILEDSKVKLVLIYDFEFEMKNYNVIDMGAIDWDVKCKDVKSYINASDLCYMIYTSGSTGKAKGLGIYHYNLVNLCLDNQYNRRLSMRDKDDRILSITNTIFDMYIYESLVPLASGMTIILANDEQSVISPKLNELCRENCPDIIQTTPSKLKLLLDSTNDKFFISCLKRVLLGGEPLLSSTLNEIREYSNAEIYNMYGPAETTVYSTAAYIQGNNIDIGTPIMNTQIFIVDKEINVLPIGVAGEICISGDGVGAGYLRLGKLTEQRFMENPFMTDCPNAGNVLYHTGDLGRWNANGKLEHLGRIDTQVKIRGLRIELGEIESVMAGFPNVGLTAADAKKQSDGKQYLVGYYIATGDVNESELRSHLGQKLPQYMIPNYFVRMDTMPLTPSGKIDRKRLPLPIIIPKNNSYIEPKTELAKTLCEIICEILAVEKFGMRDNFFECGGDSLGAISLVAKAHEKGIEIKLQDIFDHQTMESLEKYLCDKKGSYSNKNNYANDTKAFYEVLKDNNIETAKITENQLGNIILTGATGFLGCHVLEELVKNTNAKIYCLIRGVTEKDCISKLMEALTWYFGNKYNEQVLHRIIPIKGDITESIKDGDFQRKGIKTIIHTAASVKHFGTYDYFEKVNVHGTQNVVNLAIKLKARLLHISTISVSGNTFSDSFDGSESEKEFNYSERDFYVGQPLENVYVKSKYEAERRVLVAIKNKELIGHIIRVGNLTNRFSDYKFQKNYESNAFLKRIKAILELGVFPDYLLDLYSEFSYVDETAAGIIKIAQNAECRQTVFHLYNSKHLYFDKMIKMLEKIGIKLIVVDHDNFSKKLEGTVKNKETKYIYEALQNDIGDGGRLVYNNKIHVQNGFTDSFLNKVGFSWDEVSLDY